MAWALSLEPSLWSGRRRERAVVAAAGVYGDVVIFSLFWRAARVRLDPPLQEFELHFTRLEMLIWGASVAAGVALGLIAAFAPGKWFLLAPWTYSLMAIAAPLLAARAQRKSRRA